MNKLCELYNRECTDCGECDACDLDSGKACDNCGKCIEDSGSVRSLNIDDFMKRHTKKEN